MPLKPSRRLPKKYSRKVSSETKRMVNQRMGKKKKAKKERWKRFSRRIQRHADDWKASAIRWGTVCVVILVLLGVGMLLFSPALGVREIRVTRVDPRLDIEEVQNILTPMFGKHLFFVSRAEVREMLRLEIADIREIEVKKDYPSILRIKVVLDPLVAKLRITEPDSIDNVLTATGAIFDFVTDKGIYVLAPNTGSAESLPEITLVDWGVRPLPGTPLISKQLFDSMNAAEVALIREFGWSLTGREIYLRAKEFHILTEPFDLWFDLRTPVGEQLERLRVFLVSMGVDVITEYIDLRVADRVVYK
jgi:hypothetical protein